VRETVPETPSEIQVRFFLFRFVCLSSCFLSSPVGDGKEEGRRRHDEGPAGLRIAGPAVAPQKPEALSKTSCIPARVVLTDRSLQTTISREALHLALREHSIQTYMVGATSLRGTPATNCNRPQAAVVFIRPAYSCLVPSAEHRAMPSAESPGVDSPSRGAQCGCRYSQSIGGGDDEDEVEVEGGPSKKGPQGGMTVLARS
jgi:hypothetical protein